MTIPPVEIRVNGRTIKYGDLSKFISSLPRNARGKATEHVAKFFAKRFYESDYTQPYKHVTRRSAYGGYRGHSPAGWKSDKQRRFVMARIRSGEFTPGAPQRSGAIAKGWKTRGSGVKTLLYNEAPGAVWVHDNRYQAMQPAMAGWPPTDDMIEENIDDAINDLALFIVEDFKMQMDRW
jgi:hypothetical protein